MERSHLDIVKIRAMSSGKCMVTEERLNFQWVLRMPQEVRRITNHYEEENLSMLPWERLQKAVLRVSGNGNLHFGGRFLDDHLKFVVILFLGGRLVSHFIW